MSQLPHRFIVHYSINTQISIQIWQTMYVILCAITHAFVRFPSECSAHFSQISVELRKDNGN